MTPERMANLVARWVRFYTRDLPEPIARRRRDEIAADLHDHIDHERTHGTEDRRIARSIAGRLVRGLAADASWRRTIARASTPKDPTMRKTTTRPAVRVALATACLLLVPLLAMQFTDGVDWGVFDFVFAGAILAAAGLLLDAAVRTRNVAARAAAGAIGVATIAVGEADDAPGLVLFGLLLIAGAIVLTVRTARGSR